MKTIAVVIAGLFVLALLQVCFAIEGNPILVSTQNLGKVDQTSKPDLLVSTLNAYHYNTGESPWFNLPNEVDVTVKNNGTADATAFYVSLFADGELIGKQEVSGLEADSSATVQFTWTPIGDDCFEDCTFTDTYQDYELKAVADRDNDVSEGNETNNNLITVERACYNGYIADEPLENVAHGMLHGGLLFTTGDGTYGGLYSVGSSIDTTYEITLPAGASVELARLNVYYTWHYEKTSCPTMEVSITNETGTYVVPLDNRYNDIKCTCPGAPWIFPWGNYVYDITDYIQGSSTYTVTMKRTGGPSFCIAAPGIEVVYQDETKPLMEYWINEGADILIGGRRSDGGHLSLEECINTATFEVEGGVELSKVKNATLGVVSPWAGAAWTPGMANYLYFNDVELGRGVYHGYSDTYDKTLGCIAMHVGSTNAQVGVNISNVTSYLNANNNWVGQGDDGDNMMPCNAFLVVEYKEEAPPTPFMIYGWVNDSTGAPVLNPNVWITNLNAAEVFIAATTASSNYYQVLTSSRNVSAGDVLHFGASNANTTTTEFNHTVTRNEIKDGGFEQDIVTALLPESVLFDTGLGAYPSIYGVHKGTITPAHDVTLRQMYTYPCAGTGGHSEFVELSNETFYINATWNGYQSDYHNITFPHQFTLFANHTYNYTIKTGSYPQIHHRDDLEVKDGTITCDNFIDANGKIYTDWIPAIKLA